MAHEFGHAMGLPDNQDYARTFNNLNNQEVYAKDDIMATVNYSKKFKCYNTNIQMIIGAAHDRMQQLYEDYAFIDKIDSTRKKCEVKA